ncbi:MAG: NADH-quinone oxidoreductase subunit F [Deltaproteobacteria bacterium]|nr:NADH-quinone oxidoreductase subunit F [Deltaproteobacteria bacterium]
MEKPLTGRMRLGEGPVDLDAYEKAGGYAALRKALLRMTPEELIQLVKDANLRGRGGAGFPAGVKWSSAPTGVDSPRPKYVVADADEMEPGTFKDRFLMEGDPHQLIEGVILTSYAIQAEIAYVFIRWEYTRARRLLEQTIAEAYRKNYAGSSILGTRYSLEVRLHVSAGRYIAGEASSMLNALEGGRAVPRPRDPLPTISGLWGKPTVTHNVETLCNVPHIVSNGAAWFKSLGRTQDAGTKIYGVSGKVKRPGAWELPMGVTVREILEEHAGGMRDGLTLRGFLPGGASTDFLTEQHLDTPMDFESIQKAGSRLGTGGIVALDDRTCPVGMAHNLITFFARESCGWCTPCREGLPWSAEILAALEKGEGSPGDLEILEDQCRLLGPGNTFCPLAPGAVEPLQSALKYFREDFERHIREKRCPWK